MVLKTKKCLACEKELTRKQQRQKYCSYICANSGENNPQYGKLGSESARWKDDNNITLDVLHRRMYNLVPKPDSCPDCGENKTLELCNISKETNIKERYKVGDPVILATYNMDVTNWYWSCRACHQIGDGRLQNAYEALKDYVKKHGPWNTGKKRPMFYGNQYTNVIRPARSR